MEEEKENIWKGLLSLNGGNNNNNNNNNSPSVSFVLRQYEIDHRFERSSKLQAFSRYSQRGLYTVLALYLLFQALVFAGTRPSVNLPCSQWWLPLSLSVLASGVTTCSVLRKLRCAADFRHEDAKQGLQSQPHRSWCSLLLSWDATLTVCLVGFSMLAIASRVPGLCQKP